MRVRRTIALRELDTELWCAIFSAIKAALLAVASIFYTATLTLYFVAQNGAFVAERLYRLIATWHPVKPNVFRFENVKRQECYGDVIRESEKL